MKKIIYSLAGIGLCFCIAHSVHAVVLTQAAAGDAVTIVVTGGAATPAFTAFSPSTQVNISGATITNEFAIDGWHTQVANKASGKRFGMASDSSSIYYLDISTTAAPGDVTGTNSSAFSTYTAM